MDSQLITPSMPEIIIASAAISADLTTSIVLPEAAPAITLVPVTPSVNTIKPVKKRKSMPASKKKPVHQAHFLYLTQPEEFIEAKRHIYKFSQSSKKVGSRHTAPTRGQNLLLLIGCQDLNYCESEITRLFKAQFELIQEDHYEGDCAAMQRIVIAVVAGAPAVVPAITPAVTRMPNKPAAQPWRDENTSAVEIQLNEILAEVKPAAPISHPPTIFSGPRVHKMVSDIRQNIVPETPGAEVMYANRGPPATIRPTPRSPLESRLARSSRDDLDSRREVDTLAEDQREFDSQSGTSRRSEVDENHPAVFCQQTADPRAGNSADPPTRQPIVKSKYRACPLNDPDILRLQPTYSLNAPDADDVKQFLWCIVTGDYQVTTRLDQRGFCSTGAIYGEFLRFCAISNIKPMNYKDFNTTRFAIFPDGWSLQFDMNIEHIRDALIA
jgi:hypothetical protein